MASKVDTCMFMSKTLICVVYVYDCMFWACSKSDIDNIMKFSSSMVPITIGNNQREIKCLSYYTLVSKHWMMLDFSFIKLD